MKYIGAFNALLTLIGLFLSVHAHDKTTALIWLSSFSGWLSVVVLSSSRKAKLKDQPAN